MDQSGSTGDPGTPTPPTGGWAAPPPPVQAGPAGFVYADVPNRAIAYIIDGIIVAIVAGIVGAILGGIGLSTGTFEGGELRNFTLNPAGLIISGVVSAVISAAYFIYTWTSMRGTLGMKALGMQIGNAGDGKTLTMDQATRRWLVIALPGILTQVVFVIPLLGFLIGLFSIGWFLYLLWTTYSSPTKQGFHDKYANTMVVKAARSAA